MKYINSTLIGDEAVIAAASISKWSMFHIYLAAVIFAVSVVFLPVAVLLLVYAYLKISSTEVGVTTRKVVKKTGVIMRDTSEIMLCKVESVKVNQGILGRMFGYGTVVVIGSGSSVAVMKGIANPQAFRSAVYGCLESSEGALLSRAKLYDQGHLSPKEA